MVFYSEYSSFVGRKETRHRKKMAPGRLGEIQGFRSLHVQVYAFNHVNAKKGLNLKQGKIGKLGLINIYLRNRQSTFISLCRETRVNYLLHSNIYTEETKSAEFI